MIPDPTKLTTKMHLPACKITVTLCTLRLGWPCILLPFYHGSFLLSSLSSHLNTTSALRTFPTPSLKLLFPHHHLHPSWTPAFFMLKTRDKSKKFSYIYFMCMCLLEGMYVYYMCIGALRGQKKASDPLKLEFQVVMSYCMGAGNLSWVLWKSSQYS